MPSPRLVNGTVAEIEQMRLQMLATYKKLPAEHPDRIPLCNKIIRLSITEQLIRLNAAPRRG